MSNLKELKRREASLEEQERIFQELRKELEESETVLKELDRIDKERRRLEARLNQADEVLKESNRLIKHARDLRKNAQAKTGEYLEGVFSKSLNKLWADLFRRLVPEEKFSPRLGAPTLHYRKLLTATSATAEGVEEFKQLALVFSSGNVNTAALTLFLALNLIEEQKMRLLILDDPIQNMDDLHVVQLASLLRSFVRDAGRQLLVAVHEKALFDYLCLELGPTSEANSLLAIQISRKPGSWGSRIDYERHKWSGDRVALG